MAVDYRPEVERALRLKKIGNEMMRVLGGREIHPVSVRVGGFYHVPSKSELQPLVEQLKWALEASVETARLVTTLPFPDFEQDYEFVSLSHPDEYPLNEGRVVSSRGIDLDVSEYEDHFLEQHVRHSNALHSRAAGAGFVPRGAAGAVQSELRETAGRGPGDGARVQARSAGAQSVPQHHRAGGGTGVCVRGGAAPDRAVRAAAADLDPLRAPRRDRHGRHRGPARACSITAIQLTKMGLYSHQRSCRRPRRT